MVKLAWFVRAGMLAAVLILAGCVSYSREVREYDTSPPEVSTYVAPVPPASPPAYRYEYEQKSERSRDMDADRSDSNSYYYREYRRESMQ